LRVSGPIPTSVSGGSFTIVLVPLAVIAVASWAVYSAFGRYESSSGSVSHGQSQAEPLPHSDHGNTVPRPSTPDELVDGPQQQQTTPAAI
jgi:hypothetical protein